MFINFSKNMKAVLSQGNRAMSRAARGQFCTPCLKKTSKIIFVITTSNFHQIWQFLA